MPQGKPWEKYSPQSGPSGPWDKYAQTTKQPAGASGSWDEPQERTFLQSVPALAGAIPGGIMGAKAGATFGAPFGPVGVAIGGLGGAVVGAGGGAMFGEGARQGVEAIRQGSTEPLDPRRITEEANANMIGEAIGGPVGAATSRGLRAVSGPALRGAQAAADYARSAGIPIDTATRTGSRVWEGIRAGVDRLPIVGNRGAAFREGQNEALQQEFGGIMDRAAPGATGSRVLTGESIQGVLPQLKASGNKEYAEFLRLANDPSAAQTVTTGTRPGMVTSPTGAMSPGQIPVTQVIQAPVNVKAAKTALRPLLEKLEAETKLAQTAASPGLGALRNFMAMDDIIPAERALTELSAIQDLARTTDPAMRTIGEGIAAKVVPLFRKAVDDTANSLGPQAKAALDKGRELTRQRYELAKIMGTTEPAQIVDGLLQQGDRAIGKLRTLNRVAPGEVPGVARAYLQRMFEQAGKEGGFAGGRAYTDWTKLGVETKHILFPSQAKEIGQFLDLAKRIGSNPNPSGTAGTLITMGVGGLGLNIASDLLSGDAAGAAGKVGGLGTSWIGAEVLAKMLYSPTAARALRSGLLMKATDVGAKNIARIIAIEYAKARDAAGREE